MDNKVRPNQRYKDRLFVWLFGKEERKNNILELYNALHQTNYSDTGLLEITTIENAVYITMHNDVSFLLDEDMLNLWEEQSSFNPNMPIRGLLYLAQLYGSYIEEHKLNLYGEKQLTLPAPQYIIFYLGTRDEPDRVELKLSDAFPPGRQVDFTPCIELTAVMLNVNRGHNEKLLETCGVLREYSQLAWIVRMYVSTGMDAEAAIEKAVEQCIANDILRNELRANRSEVIGMLLEELDEKKIRELFFADGEREGEIKGEKRGLQQGMERFGKLIDVLLLNGRVDDARAAAKDDAVRDKLFREFNL